MPGSRIFRDDLLRGQRVLVTGGGTGIGRATALELAALGADIALIGRRPEPLQAVKAQIESAGRKALAVPCDIRDEAQVKQAVAATVAEMGGIDLLFNNAGGQFLKPTAELSLNGWNAVVGTNLGGTFLVTREVATQAMIPQKSGCVVNMLINFWNGQPGAAHSAAARAAVDNLTKTLALEWAVHNIRVNAIAAGTVRTEGLANYPEAIVRQLRSIIPLKREGRPEEVAWLVAYLASEAGHWITGETLCLDGGSQHWGSMWQIPDEGEAGGGYRISTTIP